MDSMRKLENKLENLGFIIGMPLTHLTRNSKSKTIRVLAVLSMFPTFPLVLLGFFIVGLSFAIGIYNDIIDIIKEIKHSLDPDRKGLSMVDQRTFEKLVSKVIENSTCNHNFDIHVDDYDKPEIVQDVSKPDINNEAYINEYEILVCNKCADKKRFLHRKYTKVIS